MKRLLLPLLLGMACQPAPADPAQDHWAALGDVRIAQRSIVAQLAVQRVNLQLASRLRDGDPAVTIVDGVVADSIVGRVTSSAAALWAGAGALTGPFRLAVWLHDPAISGARANREEGFDGVLFPAATDGKTCVVVIDSRWQWLAAQGSRLDIALGDAISPCLFFGRLGQPGPGMARWLKATGSAGLWYPAPLLRQVRPRYAELPLLSNSELLAVARGGSDLSSFLAAPWAAAAEATLPPYGLGSPAVRCLAGQIAGCESAFLQPRTSVRQGSLGAGVVRRPWIGDRQRLGWWIAELVTAGGIDRFERWWRESEDLSASYRTIYGAELGGAIHGIMSTTWREEAAEGQVELGPTIRSSSVVATIGWAVLVLLLPLMAASRRVRGR